MTFILDAIAILIVGAVIIWLIRLAVRLLAAFALAVACLGLALLAGGLAGFCTQLIAQHFQGVDPAVASTLVGVVAFVGTLALMVRRIWRPREGGDEIVGPSTPISDRVYAPPPIPVEEPVAPEKDRAVRNAWGRVLDLLPGETSRLRHARSSCARLLKLAEGDVLDMGLLDAATFVRRNIPTLVDSVVKLWDEASNGERIAYAEELASDLERLAERSKTELARYRQTLRDNHNIIRTHVANRTAENKEL